MGILMDTLDQKEMQPYVVLLSIFIVFVIFAFTQQDPQDIVRGFIAIHKTRGVLITDYIEVGGIGAALLNGSIISMFTIIMFIRLEIVPSGSTIMSLFLTFGFALFGKNILNILPLTFGVWLYSKVKGRPYSEYHIMGLLAATISPITSEIFFLGVHPWYISITIGVLLGVLSGFLFPMVSEFCVNVHMGYNLYNMGFAGGLLATLFIAILYSIGIEVETELYISSGNNFVLSILMFTISLVLIISGIILGDRRSIISDIVSVTKHHGTSPSDYYAIYGANIYVNMGLLCILGTLVVLLLGAELNGPTIAGILTMVGFGAFGKHLKNAVPLIAGAIIATFVNKWDPTHTSNVLAILFSTGLSPIAGKYGVVWGLIVGFVHVFVVHHTGSLSNGLNLYNNGFAAGFVVLLMLPIIEGFKKIWAERGKTF